MPFPHVKNRLAQFGLACAAAFAATAAAAAPITNWDYIVTSSFSTTSGDTSFTSGGGTQSVTSDAINWGGVGAANRSGIGITNTPRSGTLVTDGGPSPANTYTHNNNPISADFATLTSATINATLQLREQGSGNPYTSFNTSYNIRFAETANGTPCAAASPAGNPCNDIWVLTGSLDRNFTLGDYQYFFSFYAEPALDALPSAVCAAAGAAPGCIGFTTIEGQANAVDFLLEVTSERITQVPEPASIALMGVGLLGLAGMRRRQQNKA